MPGPDDNTRRDWVTKAACRGAETNLWFPERGQSTREAKQACQVCPVREQCLEHALVTGEKQGVWGGLSERERSRIRRTRPRTLNPIRHATDAGYTTHLRRGETPCDDCKTAHAAAQVRRHVATLRTEGVPNAAIARQVGRSAAWVDAVITEDDLPRRSRGPQKRRAA